MYLKLINHGYTNLCHKKFFFLKTWSLLNPIGLLVKMYSKFTDMISFYEKSNFLHFAAIAKLFVNVISDYKFHEFKIDKSRKYYFMS